MVAYKIRRGFDNGPRNPFYINMALFHLPRPRLKTKDNLVDGYPIIHIETGVAQ